MPEAEPETAVEKTAAEPAALLRRDLELPDGRYLIEYQAAPAPPDA